MQLKHCLEEMYSLNICIQEGYSAWPKVLPLKLEKEGESSTNKSSNQCNITQIIEKLMKPNLVIWKESWNEYLLARLH